MKQLREDDENIGIKIEFDDGSLELKENNRLKTGAHNKHHQNEKRTNNNDHSSASSQIDDLAAELEANGKFSLCCFRVLFCLNPNAQLYNRPYYIATPLVLLLFLLLTAIWFLSDKWEYIGLISNIFGFLMIIPIFLSFQFYKKILRFKDVKYGEKCDENDELIDEIDLKKKQNEQLTNQCNELNAENLELRMLIQELQLSPKSTKIHLNQDPGLFDLSFGFVFVFIYLFCLTKQNIFGLFV